MIEWQWRRFEALTPRQLHAVFAARESVFIVEQRCAYQELDALDFSSHHLIAWKMDEASKVDHVDEANEIAAYLRVVEPGVKFAEPSIGRVMTSLRFRRSGLGRTLMQKALERIAVTYPGQNVRISAQTYLDRFYRSFGFEPCSAEYVEDGIPHIEMLASIPRA